MIGTRSIHRSDVTFIRKVQKAYRLLASAVSAEYSPAIAKILPSSIGGGMSCQQETRGWSFITYGAEHLVLCAGVTLCAWTDWNYGKVRNIWLMLLTLVGAVLQKSAFFSGSILFLFWGMVLFRFRFMGAGDGKLMAVIGGYLGIKAGFYAVALGFLVGAVWSLWRMKHYGLAAERFCYLRSYVVSAWSHGSIRPYDTWGQIREPHHIPFAVCLAAGVWGSLLTGLLSGIC